MKAWRLAAAMLILASHAHAEALLAGGSYEVTSRLELPHLERWAIERTTTVCLTAGTGDRHVPIPVLSGNNPFSECSARNLRREGESLRYDIVCPGRDAARASAVYRIAPDRFTGRIAMVMGAKNMTMTEVQSGRRLTGCGMANVWTD